MRTALISFTAQGAETAARLADGFNACGEGVEARAYRLSTLGLSLGTFTKQAFQTVDGLIFVGAAGIAVRAIAPYVKDKTLDPAVVVVDELGQFAIPILSGHIGGANELACLAARILGAVPVITTATDLHHAFAVDVFAAKNGLAIESMQKAKEISAAVLRGETIGFFSDFKWKGDVPDSLAVGQSRPYNLYITWNEDARPKELSSGELLRLVPRSFCLGMGCRRDSMQDAVFAAAKTVLNAAGISHLALRTLATVELKAEEAAFHALAKEWRLQFTVFKAAELAAAEGEFEESPFVKRVTGVGNICERAAVLGAEGNFSGAVSQGKLVCRKTAVMGVTAALAVMKEEPVLRFER